MLPFPPLAVPVVLPAASAAADYKRIAFQSDSKRHRVGGIGAFQGIRIAGDALKNPIIIAAAGFHGVFGNGQRVVEIRPFPKSIKT